MTLFVIIGMAIITFSFRFAPLLVNQSKERVSDKIKAMLDYLPLAILSALTVPGIFQVDPDSYWVGITSAITAVILVLFKKLPLLVVILGSVAAAVIVKLLMIY